MSDDKDLDNINKNYIDSRVKMSHIYETIITRLGDVNLSNSMVDANTGDVISLSDINKKTIDILYNNAVSNLKLFESIDDCIILQGESRDGWLLEYTYALAQEAVYWSKFLHHVGSDFKDTALMLIDESKEHKNVN